MPRNSDPSHIAAGLAIMSNGTSPREASAQLASRGIIISANTLRRHRDAAKAAAIVAASRRVPAQPEASAPTMAPYGIELLQRGALPPGVEAALDALVDDLLRGAYSGGPIIGDDAVDARDLAALASALPHAARWPVFELLKHMAALPTLEP